jgi:hypothetical protein
MRAELGQVLRISAADWPLSAGEGSMPTFTESFRDSMWSPWSRGQILTESKSFGGFSAGPHHQGRPTVLGGILDSVHWLPYSPGLEHTGLVYVSLSAGESPSDALRLSGRPASPPSPWNGTCCAFCHCLWATVAKIAPSLMDNQQPNTHQPVLSKATITSISFNKR